MIVSINPKPEMSEFVSLMNRTDSLLNRDALQRPKYYANRGGHPLEDDVKAALDECAKGTVFENTIEKVSGQKFPDIVAARFYGVEVKSTKDNHWTSTGSSILESSRIVDVERIFMTFGKLGGNPIEFLSRPYEECLSGIAVTHMPRYLIDMRLRKGETIFDKMGVPYDELRLMENPVAPVSKYYRSQLKEGESLWWTGDAADEAVSAKIRIWGKVPPEEKKRYTTYGCVYYPEVFRGDYDRYALWLTSQGIVDHHIRDQFSSGGQELMRLSSGEQVKFPGMYRRIKEQTDYILHLLSIKDMAISVESQGAQGAELLQRLKEWCDIVSKEAARNSRTPVVYDVSYDALMTMFGYKEQVFGKDYQGEKIVKCQHCKMVYRQKTEPQMIGHRFREEDVCPYCNCSNGSSMEYEYRNRK
ncbi:MAG: hypothetical protein IKU60_04295 [Clostridia bacterium]|nr:hypothetical protein [Clostridia bacterium]